MIYSIKKRRIEEKKRRSLVETGNVRLYDGVTHDQPHDKATEVQRYQEPGICARSSLKEIFETHEGCQDRCGAIMEVSNGLVSTCFIQDVRNGIVP